MSTGDDGDDLVALGWDDDDEPVAPAGEPAAWRRRAGPIVALVVVAVLVVGASIASDGSPEDAGERAAATTTTTTTTTQVERAAEATTTTAPFASEPTGGRRLVLIEGNQLVVVDLDASTFTRRGLPLDGDVQRFGPKRAAIVVTGDSVFVSDGRTALRLSTQLGPDEQPRQLGQSLLMMRSAREGRVWLTRRSDGGFTITEVDGLGRVTEPARPLPVDWEPVADTGGGALVLRRAGEVQVWDVTSGRLVWQSPQNVALLGTVGTHVIWQRYCDGPFCAVHVTDTRTGEDRTFSVDGQLWQTFDWRSAFAGHPGGRFAAASATSSDPLRSADAVFVDARTGRSFTTPVTQLGTPVWSPDGAWLFLFSGDNGPDRLQVAAAVRVDRIEDGQFRVVTLRVPTQVAGDAAAVL